jgi:chitinase
VNAFARWLALACALVLAACAAKMKPEAASYRLVGYVAGWEKLPRIDTQKITALNYAFASIDANGKIALKREADAQLAQLRPLKSGNPQLRILISVGGWGADGFSDAASSAASRASFAQSAADLLARTQTDGIDLDWEYPGLPGPGIRHRAEDQQNFTLLLQALRERFNAFAREQRRIDPYLITAALGDREFVGHIELDRIHPYLDWINLMTYDFHNSLTPTTGHASGLSQSRTAPADERSVEHAVAQFLAAGVPANKLVVGVPFYAHVFADVQPDNFGVDQRYGHHGASPPWPQLVAEYINRNGYVRHWDESAKEPSLWNAGKREFVSYDDPQSLALKAQFVKARHLGGMMYWEQSQDPDGELLDVLARGLR